MPSSVAPRGPSLPRGGRTILPNNRLVAYYGGPDGPGLGVLGAGTPEQAAAAIEQVAAKYVRFGRPVQPAMELIATVAQGAPGPDGLYCSAIPAATIQRYLDVVHRHRMLLILDFQPGRSEFLPQVQAVAPFLTDPSVSVALDPEWKVGPYERPGNGLIGSASAAGINAVGRYLSGIISRHHLPDKLLVIHQFARQMLPDRDAIVKQRGLEVTLHADGEGTPALKVEVYAQLGFAHTPFHAGFKLFYRQDSRLMSPAEAMALRPQPDMITYQ